MSLAKNIYDFPRHIFGAHVTLLRHGAGKSSSLEDRLGRLELEAEVRDTVNTYAYLYDAKDLDGLMELYLEESAIVNSSGTYVGRSAIRSLHESDLPRTEYSFHHMTNVHVTVGNSGDDVWTAGYLYNLAARAGTAYGTVGTFIFHLTKRQGRWKLLETRIALTSRHVLEPISFKPAVDGPIPTSPDTSAELIRG